MAVWTKGKRCGENNCPSRFWTIIDGRRVCQNGHMAHEIAEFTQDDDDVLGRRVQKRKEKLVGLEEEGGPRKRDESVGRFLKRNKPLNPAERKIEELNVYKRALRVYIRVFQQDFGLGAEFEHTTRNLFIQFANKSRWSPVGDSKRSCSPIVLLAIVRISLLLIHAPVYVMDIILLVRTGKLPYMWKSPGWDPTNSIMWTPTVLPSHQSIELVKAKLIFLLQIKVPTIDPKPLVYKLVNALMLPPKVYTGALCLVNNGRTTRASASEVTNPGALELVCIASVVITFKYAYDVLDSTQVGDGPNINVWQDLVRKYWSTAGEFWDADERDVPHWSSEKLERFLGFYQQILQSEYFDEAMEDTNFKRLFKLFPLEPTNSGFRSQLDPKVHEELFAALQSAVPKQPTQLEKPLIYQTDGNRATRPPIMRELDNLMNIFEGPEAPYNLAFSRSEWALRRVDKAALESLSAPQGPE